MYYFSIPAQRCWVRLHYLQNSSLPTAPNQRSETLICYVIKQHFCSYGADNTCIFIFQVPFFFIYKGMFSSYEPGSVCAVCPEGLLLLHSAVTLSSRAVCQEMSAGSGYKWAVSIYEIKCYLRMNKDDSCWFLFYPPPFFFSLFQLI